MFLRYFKFLIFCLILITYPCYAAVNVAVSILPQKFFLKQIAGDRVNVVVLVPSGFNPATYEPKVFQMKQIEKARLYFAIGVPVEKVWLKKFKSLNKDLIIVHTDKGIKKFDNDPHIWLSPPLVKKQAIIISDWLIRVDPSYKEFYKKNLKKFLQKIDSLDKKIKLLLKGKKGRAFLVYHPCWRYFAERYGLRQISIEKDGKEPTGKRLSELINYCKELGIKAVFVQPQFSQKAAKVIASQLNAKIVVIDPLSEKWDKNLLSVAQKIKDFI